MTLIKLITYQSQQTFLSRHFFLNTLGETKVSILTWWSNSVLFITNTKYCLFTLGLIHTVPESVFDVSIETITLSICTWFLKSRKVSRSWNMKQKIYEILTSPKIQTNCIILYYILGMFLFMFWQISVAIPLSSANLTYLVCSNFSG